MPNLHNRYKSAERKISQKNPEYMLNYSVPGWVPFKIVSDSPALHSRWLLLLKIEISSIVHCCFSISQNQLKF
jgi:tetrahydromethanopterin S-methyltransferase subunit E